MGTKRLAGSRFSSGVSFFLATRVSIASTICAVVRAASGFQPAITR